MARSWPTMTNQKLIITQFSRPSYQDADVKAYLKALPKGTFAGLFNPWAIFHLFNTVVHQGLTMYPTHSNGRVRLRFRRLRLSLTSKSFRPIRMLQHKEIISRSSLKDEQSSLVALLVLPLPLLDLYLYWTMLAWKPAYHPWVSWIHSCILKDSKV